MRAWLKRWDALRTTFWFVPAVMAIAAIGLALLTLELDKFAHAPASSGWGWTYQGGPEGARAVLATIAGSMITVAGVVFSITIVALSLATGQFGPRLLRNFIRDPSNQFVLGTFTSAFIYCLLVLRTVRGTDHEQFVPGISVTVGTMLALGGLGVLIYFIHHVAVSIQAPQVIAAVAMELQETIQRLWPEELGKGRPRSAAPAETALDEDPAPVAARTSGYLDAIDDEKLLRAARERNLIVRLAIRPGHFVVRDSVLAFVSPKKQIDDELCETINGLCTLAAHRTPFQDVEFAVDQLVEIAVRALSPGINDPFTALTCIDRLGEALCQLCQRSAPSPYRYDEENQLRVVAQAATFASVADCAFNQIRQYGSSSAAVLIRMLETIAVIANHAFRKEDRAALERHADLVHRASIQGLPEQADRKDVEERFLAVQQALAPRS